MEPEMGKHLAKPKELQMDFPMELSTESQLEMLKE